MNRHVRALIVPGLVAAGLGTGLLREIFLAYLFGTSREIEVFRVAFGLPSILSESLAVSFVSVLIPVLLAERSQEGLRRVVWAACIVAGIVLVAGILTMPLQARLLAPGIAGDDRAALIFAGMLCWVMFFFAILSLPMRASMSVENRLWPGASTALFRSAGFIAALAALSALGLSPTAGTAAWAAVVAGLTVLAMHGLALGAAGRARHADALRHPPPNANLRPLLGALTLVFGTQVLLSGGRIIDRAVASPLPIGTLAAVEYSYAILMALAAVAATSANILLAPRIGRVIRDSGRIPVRYWKLIAAIAGTATVVGVILSAAAEMVVSLIFEHGAFGPEDTALTARVLRVHALALGPLVLALVLTQVLILTGGQRWLVPLAALKLTIKLLALWVLLTKGFRLEAITVSLGVSEVALTILLMFTLYKRFTIHPHNSLTTNR